MKFVKVDFSKPLSEWQLNVVRDCQSNNNDPYKCAEKLGIDPDDVFLWTIQDYEEKRNLLKKELNEGNASPEVLRSMNRIYEAELDCRKTWEQKQAAESLRA